MRFLAACNPFQLIKKGSAPDDELMCNFEDPKLKEMRMSHRVHPLKHSLLDYVWNFGSLTEDQEKEYIQSILKHPQKEKYKQAYVDIIYEAHKFIKELEKNVSSVSLRDFARVDKLFGFSLAFIREMKDIEKPKKKKNRYANFEERWMKIKSDKLKEEDFWETLSLVLGLNYYFRLHKDSKIMMSLRCILIGRNQE